MTKLLLPLLLLAISFSNYAQITPDWSITNGTTANDAIDYPTSSASDNAGNTYISGWSTYNEANAGHYLFLKKISESGQLAWEKAFDVQQTFSGNSYSRIALDNQQNIVIAAADYYYNGLYIAKISPSGNILWSDTLNPNANYTVTKVITDSNNNIYIGASNGDFVLIKYNQDGVLQYNHSIDGGLFINDVMKNISLDNNNNIIFSGNRGSLPGDNSAIVYKFDNNGNQLWNTIIQHNNTTQIEVNDHTLLNDEIVVCGYFFNNTDLYRGYLTKLNSSGVQGSVTVDPQNSSSYKLVAALGNEIVVGVGDAQVPVTVSTSLKKFSSSLSEIWNQVLPIGGVYYQLFTFQNTSIYFLIEHFSSSSNIKNTVYRYNENGVLQWSLENDSSTYLSRSDFVSISSNNSVRLAAPYHHSNNVPYNDYMDIKVMDINNSTGQVSWTFQYDGTTFSEDRATLMTKDSQGNIFIAGTFSAGWNNNAVGIAKYNAAGNLIWIKKIDFSAGNNKDDEPLSITCDAQDNLIVGGYTTNVNKDFLLLKFNSTGDLLWQKIFNGTGNNTDQFSSVITDAASNIYAVGLSVRNFGGSNNYYVHQVYKYNSDGLQLWENWDYSNPTGNQKIILSTSQQMVYVACEYYGNTTNPSDLGVFKLRADNGSYLHWTSYSGTSNNSNDRIKGIEVDSAENIYLNGNVSNSGLKTTIIKYDSTLTEIWDKVYSQNSIGNQFFQDNNQDLLITMGTMSTDSVAIIKYNTNGTIIWTKKLIDNQNNISNTLIKQLNDTTYTVVATFNSGSISLNKVFVIDTSGNTLLIYTTSNSDTYYLRDIEVHSNALYVCGFYADFINHYAFHENYYINKYLINIDNIQNQPPTISSIQNTIACTNDEPLQIPFTIGDEDVSQLTITVTSTNTSVIPSTSLSITGSGTQRMLNITFSGSTQGQTTINIQIQDAEGLSVSTSFQIQVDICTGVEEVNSIPTMIYPNPAYNILYLDINVPANEYLLHIYSVTGQLLKQVTILASSLAVDVSDLIPGAYRAVILSKEKAVLSEQSIQIIR